MSDVVETVAGVPFVGLRPFDTADSRWFFGRDRETAVLSRKLRRARFTAVVGPSGSGKSSVVRAGAVPLLKQDGWVEIIAKPGSAPIDRLARALAATAVSDSGESVSLAEARRFRFASILRASAYGLADIVDTIRPEASWILLVVDQFEELFRYGEEATGAARAAMREEGRAFVELLLSAAARKGGRVHVCVTMRSDFFGNCSAYAGLAEAVSEAQFLVPLPHRDQLEEAIIRPVEQAGAHIEKGVVQRLLVDVEEETDQLPLLEHTLRRLWDKSSGAPRTIRESDYVKVGKLAGSIETKAEEVSRDLGKAHAIDLVSLSTIMKALTSLDERDCATRRPQRRGELLALLLDAPRMDEMVAKASLERVLDALQAEDTSFLQIGEGDDLEVDISHEALIRGWTKLAGPERNFAAGWLREEREDGERWRGYLRSARENVRLSLAEQLRLKRWLSLRSLGEIWSRRYGSGWAEVKNLRRKSLWRSLIGMILVLVVIGPLSYGVYYRLRQAAIGSARLASMSLAAGARAKAMAGDARLAALMARMALPAVVNRAEPRYVERAEVALLDALARPIEIQRLIGHDVMLSGLSFSPDGARIISASEDHTLRLWDATTGQAVGAPLTGHSAEVKSASFSPDGKRIVSASADTTLRLWDATTGQAVGAPLTGHSAEVKSASFSPDGKRIVSASADTTLRLWDATTGQAVGAPLTGHSAEVMSASFSPDGKRIVSASDDTTLRLWDATTGQAVGAPLTGHSAEVMSASFSPDGKRIVSASNDKTLRLWDATTGQAVGTPLQGHTGRVLAGSFSPNGERIVSASADTTLRLWDVSTGQPIGAPLQGHSGSVLAGSFSPDGKRIVSAAEGQTLRIWDIGPNQPVAQALKGHSEKVFTASFSPDGKRIVSASYDTTLRLWDATTGQAVGTPLQGHTGRVFAGSFSPNGERIVSASDDKTLRLWDATTGQAVGAPLTGHDAEVMSASFSPDGKRIVSASYDKTLRLWDATTGKAVGTPLQGHTGRVLAGSFSPDGKRIVSASADTTLRLWDATTGQAVGTPLQGHTDAVWEASFSPDGKRIVSASEDKTLRLWDATTGQAVGTPLQGHTDAVWEASFSPDGKRIVSGSRDTSLRVWDAATGLPIGDPMLGHTNAVRGASFSPDGRYIVSASFDHTLRLWGAPPHDLATALRKVDELCPLSDAEREAAGLLDPRFSEPASDRTPAQKRACGLALGAHGTQ